MRGVILSRHAVRLGFRQIKGLSEDRMKTFVGRRGNGYSSVRDVWLRSGLDVGEIEKLAEADAFRSIGLDRRAALWAVRALDGKSAAEKLPLFDRPALMLRDFEPATNLPEMPLGEHVVHDYRTLGLSLKAHPVGFLRERLDHAGVIPNALLHTIANGRRVTVAGLVLVRQRPGKGNAIFLTLEDEEGVANIIFWQRTFERFRAVVMGAKFVRVTGKLQSESGVVHIVAEKIEDLSHWLTALLEKAAHLREASPGERNENILKSTRSAPEGRDRSAAWGQSDLEALADEARKVMPKGRNFQ
jgi:error-prone DNA polymerase